MKCTNCGFHSFFFHGNKPYLHGMLTHWICRRCGRDTYEFTAGSYTAYDIKRPRPEVVK